MLVSKIKNICSIFVLKLKHVCLNPYSNFIYCRKYRKDWLKTISTNIISPQKDLGKICYILMWRFCDHRGFENAKTFHRQKTITKICTRDWKRWKKQSVGGIEHHLKIIFGTILEYHCTRASGGSNGRTKIVIVLAQNISRNSKFCSFPLSAFLERTDQCARNLSKFAFPHVHNFHLFFVLVPNQKSPIPPLCKLPSEAFATFNLQIFAWRTVHPLHVVPKASHCYTSEKNGLLLKVANIWNRAYWIIDVEWW
jgi:hypothetical protein